MARKRKSSQNLISEMNVVPYIDVMLVLLIIFMVTAPMLNQGIEVNLPKAGGEAVEMSKDNLPIIITLNIEGKYFIETNGAFVEVSKDALIAKILKDKDKRPSVKILIKGDEGVEYGKIVTIMDILNQNNITNFGLLTKK
jgi:biopolymer transport protein TolR